MLEIAPDTSDSVREAFKVSLPNFEGPLDLLLHLLKEHQIDVLDLPVALITLKYLQHLEAMREIDLDIAGEFLVMAATLIHLKSRMLLPADAKPEGQGPVLGGDGQDPRADLVRRLLEYQKYRDVAQQLGTRGLLGREVFSRQAPADPIPLDEGELGLVDVSAFKLVEALSRVVASAPPAALQVAKDGFSLVQTVRQIATILRREQGTVRFYALFENAAHRGKIIGAFLALLELCKMRLVRISQTPGEDDLAVSEVGSSLDSVLDSADEGAMKELDRDYT